MFQSIPPCGCLPQLTCELVRDRPGKALDVVFCGQATMLVRYICSKGVSFNQAEDILSEAVEVAVKKMVLFKCPSEGCAGEINHCGIKSWMYSIVDNKLKEYWNHFYNMPLGLDSMAVQQQVLQDHLREHVNSLKDIKNLPPDVRSELDIVIRQAIYSLSKAEKEVIILMYFRDIYNATEIANILGKKSTAVRKARQRAYEKMRQHPALRSHPKVLALFENEEMSQY